MSASEVTSREQRPPVLLLIENDENDVFLFRRALSRLKFSGAVHLVCSVSEARDYLDGHGKFTDRSYYRSWSGCGWMAGSTIFRLRSFLAHSSRRTGAGP